MTETTNYISTAINTVFKNNPGKREMANGYLAQYSDDTATLLSKLGGLCKCDFTALAKLQNVTPSQAVNNAISTTITNAGGELPSDFILHKRISALEDKYAAILTNPTTAVCGKFGTLGSFYSCASLDDTSPILIATGSELCAAQEQARQKCTNWAFLKEFTTVNSKIITDTTNSEIYVSISATGGCFNAVGDLQTLPTYATMPSYVNRDPIPSLKVVCSGSNCSTVALTTEFGYDDYFIPSLPITCTNNLCTTSPFQARTRIWDYTIDIPSLTVGFIEPTAGSLYALCMYELDH